MLKITPADHWFSLCVRERAEWKCERCGKQFVPPTMGLHCSHFKSRGHWAVRFHPLNGFSLCYGCHSYFGQNPEKHKKWVKERIGPKDTRMLERLADTSGKEAKRALKEETRHYKTQYEAMLIVRSKGAVGRLEFIGY